MSIRSKSYLFAVKGLDCLVAAAVIHFVYTGSRKGFPGTGKVSESVRVAFSHRLL